MSKDNIEVQRQDLSISNFYHCVKKSKFEDNYLPIENIEGYDPNLFDESDGLPKERAYSTYGELVCFYGEYGMYVQNSVYTGVNTMNFFWICSIDKKLLLEALKMPISLDVSLKLLKRDHKEPYPIELFDEPIFKSLKLNAKQKEDFRLTCISSAINY